MILGGGLQAISTARSLKENKYNVILWVSHKDYSTCSNAIDFCIIDSEIDNIDKLINVVNKHSIHVIIPMSDRLAIYLSKSKQTIFEKGNCMVAVPDYEVIDLASDKLKLMNLCKTYGFPHPRTFKDIELTDATIDNLPYPVLVKPNHSVGARGIIKVYSPEELKKTLPKIRQNFGDCHIQEYITGNLPYYNVMIFRDTKGMVINSVILKIIRYYPIDGGSSCMCETVVLPDLVDLCCQILQKLNYTGFADFDVLKTIDGKYKIIEINPRLPASLRGASISGVNFPDLIVSDLLQIPLKSYVYQPGKILRYLGLDILWFLSSSQRFHTVPSWFKFFGRNIFYQEGGFADWKPMIKSLLANFGKLEFQGGKIRKKKNI